MLSKLKARTNRAKSSRDPRLWLGVGLVVGSAIAGNLLVRGMAHRDVAFVMVHSVAAGTVVGMQDVREVAVAVPGDTDLASSGQLVGAVASRDLQQGELVTTAALAGYTPATVRVVSLPIKAGHLPMLEHGSVVEVWVTPSMQGMEIPGPAHIVVSRAVVVAAPATSDATSDAAITVQVDAMDVSALATALRDGTVDVALVPGATS